VRITPADLTKSPSISKFIIDDQNIDLNMIKYKLRDNFAKKDNGTENLEKTKIINSSINKNSGQEFDSLDQELKTFDQNQKHWTRIKPL